jgi:hypothetical protein
MADAALENAMNTVQTVKLLCFCLLLLSTGCSDKHTALPVDLGVDASQPDSSAKQLDADIRRDSSKPQTDLSTGSDTGCSDPDSRVVEPVASLDELKKSVVSLDPDWRFKTDPADVGVKKGWHQPSFDDSGWSLIAAGKHWEDQGYAGYDGIGWYRRTIAIPASWKGSVVRFEASGVDDEYDLYVNGKLIKHFGEHPDRSVYIWRTRIRIDQALTFGADNVIAVRVNDWGSGGGLWRSVTLRRALDLAPYKKHLPEPVIADKPDWITLYWQAWRMAWEKVSFGNKQNGLKAAYMDEGFNEQIYQWDSSFICLFARYGWRLFPVMATLDNFYDRQRKDGYIQRVYSETDGKELVVPSDKEPVVNPPLFAWVEYDYYRFSGDKSRLARVFPKLEDYFEWLEKNVRAPEGKGLYYQTDLGSGMDNTPRGDVEKSAWVDMSAQQALSAWYLSKMADVIGNATARDRWRRKHSELKADINRLLWSSKDGCYYDLTRDGHHAGVKHIGIFWPMLARVSEQKQVNALVSRLKDPADFWRPHPFPTLAKSHADYSPDGHYWRGGVWAPTNYMVVRGLALQGQRALARQVAEKHIEHLWQAYDKPPRDGPSLAPEERDGEYKTLWECYSPEQSKPATRWDNTFLSRQDFVGWTGLGPIAMLIENVLGFDVVGAENLVRWTVTRSDRHGIKRMPLGRDNQVSLVAQKRTPLSAPIIEIEAKRPFVLELSIDGQPAKRYDICPGKLTLDTSHAPM